MNTSKGTKLYLVFLAVSGLSLFSCEKSFDEIETAVPDTELSFRSTLPTANLFVSSNTTPNFGMFDVANPGNIASQMINVANTDADGIALIEYQDALFQLDRTNNRVKAYANVSQLEGGSSPTPSAVSSSDFTNGREISINQGLITVAQDADPSNGNLNKLLVYRASLYSIMLYKTFTTDINLWGVHAYGNDLYAVVDNSDLLAFYQDFNSKPSGALSPNWKIHIEGIVRTHGLTYDPLNDIMVLTDVADATSATDGAIHVITNFSQKAATAVNGSGTIPLNQQIRISGSNTLLGNPVDVAFSQAAGKIYVAERANGGGRVLIFNTPAMNGNPTPIANVPFAGASALYYKH